MEGLRRSDFTRTKCWWKRWGRRTLLRVEWLLGFDESAVSSLAQDLLLIKQQVSFEDLRGCPETLFCTCRDHTKWRVWYARVPLAFHSDVRRRSCDLLPAINSRSWTRIEFLPAEIDDEGLDGHAGIQAREFLSLR